MTSMPVRPATVRRALVVLVVLVTSMWVAASASTASAAPLRAGGFTSSIVASGDPVQGTSVALAVTVEADTSRKAVVDVEIYDARGQKVFQDTWSGEALVAGRPRVFDTTWNLPADAEVGVHVVRIGIFADGWGALWHWNDDALRLKVVSAAPTVTTLPAPGTNPPPPPPTMSTTTTPPPTTTTTPPPSTTTTPPPTTPHPTSTTGAPPPPPTAPRDAQWFEDFAGDTMADFDAEFATETATVGASTPSPNRTWTGQHNMACAGPDTERVVHPGQEFWLCAPAGPDSAHVMSSAGGSSDIGGYSVVAFSPRRSFSDASQVCWDVNLTASAGARLWWEVQIIPEAGFRANANTILYGNISNNFGMFQRDVPSGSVVWDAKGEQVIVYDAGKAIYDPGPDWLDPTVRFVTNDRAKRETNCITDLGNGKLQITQTRTGTQTYDRVFAGALPSDFRVIYSAHDYNAGKDGSLADQTWHWDNLTVR